MGTGRALYSPSTGRALYNPTGGRALYSGQAPPTWPSALSFTWSGDSAWSRGGTWHALFGSHSLSVSLVSSTSTTARYESSTVDAFDYGGNSHYGMLVVVASPTGWTAGFDCYIAGTFSWGIYFHRTTATGAYTYSYSSISSPSTQQSTIANVAAA